MDVHSFFGLIANAAGDAVINPTIPGSPDNASSPGGIVANFYQFALMLGGLLAFGVIIYGALEYTVAAGNPTKQHDARDRITQAFVGLLLLAGIYFILNIINPNLTKLQLAPLEGVKLPAQVDNPSGTGLCTPTSASSPASASNLANTCFGANADKASSIANAESNGDPSIPSGVDRCQPGGEPVSFGLFQINISANSVGGLNCASAFSRQYTGVNHDCTITNQSLYDQCVTAAKNPQKNIEVACRLSNNGANWGAWGANRICGFAR